MAKPDCRTKQNCWEFTNCGRGPGGARVGDAGPCPAATEAAADGKNGGTNGGRVCWTVAGTYCGGKLQGTYAAKIETCLRCEFCRQVLSEESRQPPASGGRASSARPRGVKRASKKVHASTVVDSY